MQSKFAKAGAIRQTVSQVFNKDGIQRLGNLWEYTDEKAFVDCQLLFREAEQRFNKTEIPQKLFSNRGVILHDVYFWYGFVNKVQKAKYWNLIAKWTFKLNELLSLTL